MSKKHILIVIFTLIALFFVAFTHRNKETWVQNKPSPVVTCTRSDLEIRTFWDTEVNDVVKSIIKSESPYPEVNKHFQEYLTRIIEKTGKSLTVNLSTKYHKASDLVEASGGYDEKGNSAIMEFYVPSIMDNFEANQKLNRPHWREAFKTHVLIIFMHEMEHIIKPSPSQKSINMEEESRAWYDTCTYTVAPLMQKYRIPVSGDTWVLYQAWLDSNGQRFSPVWQDAIRNLYSKVIE